MIAFKPSHVILQDFTLVEFLLIGYSVVVALTDLLGDISFLHSSGVPAVVDFAAMREAVKDLGGDPVKIVSS